MSIVAFTRRRIKTCDLLSSVGNVAFVYASYAFVELLKYMTYTVLNYEKLIECYSARMTSIDKESEMFRMQIIGAVLALVSTTVLSGEKSHSRKTDSLNGLKCVMNCLLYTSDAADE